MIIISALLPYFTKPIQPRKKNLLRRYLLTCCYKRVTNPAAPPTLIAPEQAIARLIAALCSMLFAIIDASLLPGFYRRHLRAQIAAYFARLTADLTTPHQPRKLPKINPASPKAQPTTRQNPTGAAPRVLLPHLSAPARPSKNLQKPVFTPIPLRA